MLAPALIFLALMIAFPLGKVIHDAFTHVHLINKSMTGFAGLENFKTVIEDEHFMEAVQHTVLWTVFSVLMPRLPLLLPLRRSKEIWHGIHEDRPQ